MKNPKKTLRTGNIFWGLLLILAAVFLIAGQFGVLEEVGVFSIIFAIFWVAILIEGIARGSFGKILFSLAFLFIIFDEQLGIKGVSSWTVLLAALLGTIGLNMIFKRKKHYYYEGSRRREQGDSLKGNKIFFRTTFGAAVKYVNSDDFEYAYLESKFSDMKVFFEQAMIQNGKATIELDVSFSGVELYFPESWSVVNQTGAAFGGLDEKNQRNANGSTVVTLVGDINFSGVTIIYV